MESTMSPEFGSTTGNTLTTADADSGRSDQTGLRIIFAVSEFLRSVQNPAQSAEWTQVKERMYGEQLAAVAGLTVGARLVYGDLPKDVTFRRLLHGCSAIDLDRSFGHRSARNFASMLGQTIPDLEDDLAEKILMTDRECALCYSIDAAARGTAASGRGVVAIVGRSPTHLPHELWMYEDCSPCFYTLGASKFGNLCTCVDFVIHTTSSCRGGTSARNQAAVGERCMASHSATSA